ncbi:uncharacterized protein LOC134586132 [Pelobates fuscus]|uniref:uncharacterized protein LOC134586132 n=1 Tax=Pelobates fuscus TaxID=191477 RepID=UPI002FE47730
MSSTYFSTTGVLLALAVLYLVHILKLWIQNIGKNLPPGPRALPLIGNLHMINLMRPSHSLMELSKQYGTIFRIQMGSVKMVVLSGYETVKSALVDNADDFAERPFVPIFEDINQGWGVPFSHGENWKEMRRFTLSTLRDFGMGRSTIEDKIVEEFCLLIKELELEKGKPTDLAIIINLAVGNIITSIVLGHRFDYKDPTLRRLMHLVNENMRLIGSPSVQRYNVFPLLRYLPGDHLKVKKNISELHSFLQKTFLQHLKELDRDDKRSFIDAFLVRQQEEEANPNSFYHEANLLSIIVTLFTAGTETTASTIRWVLLFMTKYPDIQKRVHEEIDNVIGTSLPKYEHRVNMPYTSAVIHETQRRANIVPMNLPRETTKDIMFQGYHLQRGTYIIPLLESVLYDKTQFENPESFCPEHFLDSDGRFVKNSAFMPFSAGKRVCIGETLAKMELFLFFTSLMQSFSFHPAPGDSITEIKPAIGFTTPPVAQKICIISRSQGNQKNTTPEIAAESTWLTHKPVIHGELIKRAHYLKQTSQTQQVTWCKQLHDLNKLNQTNPTPELKSQNSETQNKIQTLARTKVGYSLRKLKATHYSQGNRASKILAQRLRDRQAMSKIAHIEAPNGDRIVATKAISDEFTTYYETLYNLKNDPLTPLTSPASIDDYLKDAHLPTLSQKGMPSQSPSLNKSSYLYLQHLEEMDVYKRKFPSWTHAFTSDWKSTHPGFKETISNINGGLIFSHGENWKVMRRFTITTLRDFGMGKSSIEVKIVDECDKLIQQFQSFKGKPFDCSVVTNAAIANIIVSITLGYRMEYEDPMFMRLLSLTNDNVRLVGSPMVLMYNLSPSFFNLFPGSHKTLVKNIEEIHAFIRKTFIEHVKELDANDQRSFIDAYLVQQKEEEMNPQTFFDDLNLISLVRNLFSAGMETTTTTIRWGLLLMVKHTEIQEKVQDEISRVIGTSPPRYDHRFKMPYTNAVIHEIQRFASIVPMNLPHETTKDVNFKGYFIPKGTYIVPLLYSVLRDKTQFAEPEKFNPNHFLDSRGDFVKNEAFIPFSAGRRVCAGENLAQMELFLFFTNLLQKFYFHLPPGVTDVNLTPEIGIVTPPVRYRICAISRV